MKKYRRKATQWQQKDNEEKQMNKTEFIKVRCTLEEKQRIKAKAESTGRKFSEYCREILKDESWVPITKNLSICAKEAFKRFFDPHFRIDDDIYKVLNLTRDDRKV